MFSLERPDWITYSLYWDVARRSSQAFTSVRTLLHRGSLLIFWRRAKAFSSRLASCLNVSICFSIVVPYIFVTLLYKFSRKFPFTSSKNYFYYILYHFFPFYAIFILSNIPLSLLVLFLKYLQILFLFALLNKFAHKTWFLLLP